MYRIPKDLALLVTFVYLTIYTTMDHIVNVYHAKDDHMTSYHYSYNALTVMSMKVPQTD